MDPTTVVGVDRAAPSAARTFVWVAFTLAVVHAAFSAYWAAGGTWLLATVGQWAVTLVETSPGEAGVLLGSIAVVKVVAGAVPVVVSYGRLPGRSLWRALSWCGGSLLVLYGSVNVAVGAVVLAGGVEPDGGYDRDAMIGHAFLWDPLFAAWGAALLASLWLSRHPRDAARVGPTRGVSATQRPT